MNNIVTDKARMECSEIDLREEPFGEEQEKTEETFITGELINEDQQDKKNVSKKKKRPETVFLKDKSEQFKKIIDVSIYVDIQ